MSAAKVLPCRAAFRAHFDGRGGGFFDPPAVEVREGQHGWGRGVVLLGRLADPLCAPSGWFRSAAWRAKRARETHRAGRTRGGCSRRSGGRFS